MSGCAGGQRVRGAGDDLQHAVAVLLLRAAAGRADRDREAAGHRVPERHRC